MSFGFNADMQNMFNMYNMYNQMPNMGMSAMSNPNGYLNPFAMSQMGGFPPMGMAGMTTGMNMFNPYPMQNFGNFGMNTNNIPQSCFDNNNNNNNNIQNEYNNSLVQKPDATEVNPNRNPNGICNRITVNDIKTLQKYNNGDALIEEKEGMFDGLGMQIGIMGAFGGIKSGYNVFKNRHDISGYYEKLKAEREVSFNKFKKNGGIGSGKAYKSAMNDFRAKSIKDLIPEGKKLEKLSPEAKSLYAKAAEHAEAVNKGASRANAHINIANKYLYKAKLAAREAAKDVKPEGFFGKIGHFFSKTLGLSKLAEGAEKLAVKNPIAAKVLKVGKSVKGWAILQGLFEAPKIYKAFSHSFGCGIKQTLQSGAKTLASCLGWGAGEYLGAEGGAALGAAIGSIVPGVGTVIGGAIGGLCGLVGGFVVSNMAEKGVSQLWGGKDACDVADEEEKQQTAQNIYRKAQADPRALQEVVAPAYQKLQQEKAQTPETQLVSKSLNNIINSTGDATANANQTPAANNNSFGSLTASNQNSNVDDYTKCSLDNNSSQNQNTNFNYNTNNAGMMQQYMMQQALAQNPFATPSYSMNSQMGMMNPYFMMNQNLI